MKPTFLIALLSSLLFAPRASGWYDPGTQRWLNRDPIQEDGGANFYAFSENGPIDAADLYGLSCEKKIYRVYKAIQRQRKLVRQVNEISNKNAERAVKDALDSINEGKKVIVAPSEEARNMLSKRLSTDGKLRGPERSRGYPEHTHPNKGPYTDTHIEAKGAAAAAIVAEALIPQSQRVSRTPNASPFDLTVAALWDVASAVDPIFVTDALEWAFNVRPEDFCDGN